MGLNLLDIAIWWLVLEVIGFFALPVAFLAGSNLRDHGYSISKPLGLVILVYVSWILSLSGLKYSTYTVFLSLGIMAACALMFFKKRFWSWFEKSYVIRFELLFFISLAGFAVIRAFSPDVYWTGGEKFMDMTFINSILRTSQFPPHDPWMAGTVLQYYYFGYLIVSDLIKISGILPSIAFNLATASFFALSLTTAFGIGYNLTEKIRYGILTAFFVTVAGNLVGFFQLMDLIQKKDPVNGLLAFDYWQSSRVIPDTINEFPYFSFLQGDVHAHMISIAFQLLIILLLLNIFRSSSMDIIPIFILGLCIGFLYPLNTWDYPVYLFLAIFVLSIHFFKESLLGDDSKRKILKLISSIGSVLAISYLLYLPYHLSYKLDRSISFIESGRTSITYYLAIYVLFLFLFYRFVILKSGRSYLKNQYFLVLIFFLFVISAALRFELLLLLIPLLLLSVRSMIREVDNNHVFLLILIITGIFISLFCELFYINDALGAGNHALFRMNTVFKMYLQNWVLWGAASGAIVYQFSNSFSRKKTWGVVAILLILMVSVYPVFATIGKSSGFRGEPTLDGEAYIKKEHPQDYAGILWFKNISGQPVVLQAPGELYQWNTYVTAFTGLPTVIGWAGHELNWNYPSRKEIDTRWSDVDTIYRSRNLEEVEVLIRKYDVTYIYFGEVENKKYISPALFASHPDRFEKVFEYGDVTIFKVKNR